MKTITFLPAIFTIAVLYASHPCIGQPVHPWSVRRAYLNGSASINGTASLQFNTHFKNKWVGFIGYEAANPESKNLPSDYQPAISYLFILGWEDPIPTDHYSMVTTGMGRVLTAASDKAWVMATGGISIGKYKEVKYQPQPETQSGIMFLLGQTSSNYRTTTESQTMVGLSLGVEGHVNLARFIALSSGVKTILANTGIYPTFNLGIDIGLMRPAKKDMVKKTK